MNTIKHEAEVFKKYAVVIEENFNGLFNMVVVRRGKQESRFDDMKYKTPHSALEAAVDFIRKNP